MGEVFTSNAVGKRNRGHCGESSGFFAARRPPGRHQGTSTTSRKAVDTTRQRMAAPSRPSSFSNAAR